MLVARSNYPFVNFYSRHLKELTLASLIGRTNIPIIRCFTDEVIYEVRE